MISAGPQEVADCRRCGDGGEGGARGGEGQRGRASGGGSCGPDEEAQAKLAGREWARRSKRAVVSQIAKCLCHRDGMEWMDMQSIDGDLQEAAEHRLTRGCWKGVYFMRRATLHKLVVLVVELSPCRQHSLGGLGLKRHGCRHVRRQCLWS
jgi:hypothetical protein